MAVAWVFRAERSEMSRVAARRAARDGAIVPSLWRLEVGNALRTAVRRGRCDQAYADGALRWLTRLRVTTDPDTDKHAWGETRRLALAQDLTLYDAAYLELATRLAHPLATRDAALIRAARTIGVEVIGP